MNLIFKFSRYVLSLGLVFCALGISTTVASAAKPTTLERPISGTVPLSGVCSFTVYVTETGSSKVTQFFDKSGALTRIHVHNNEQDTFTANGKTLVGLPFVSNIDVLFDSLGNITHVYSQGLLEKVPLPDGSLFVSAGRVDAINHPGATFILTPDSGNSGNLAAFCAALSP
jgi:hypothetical protein